jgi:hypothetical protein
MWWDDRRKRKRSIEIMNSLDQKRKYHLSLAFLAAVGLFGCAGNPVLIKSAPTLDDALGLDPRAALTEVIDRERKIQTCMVRQGFKYVPTSASSVPPVSSSSAFRSRYGYGIATLQLETMSSQSIDPNRAYVDSLSVEEQKAYSMALVGGPDQIGIAPCVDAGKPSAVQIELLAVKYRTVAKVFATSEAKAVARKWSLCMKEAGLGTFRNPTDVPKSLGDEVILLRGKLRGPGFKEALETLAGKEMKIYQSDKNCRTAVQFDERIVKIFAEVGKS